MEQYLERIIPAIHRIESLNSLMRVFDLIHWHYSARSVPQNFENLDEVCKAQGDLYVIILSYLFSLFDKTGINIVELSKAPISESAKSELEKITGIWNPLCKPVTRIRHNLGFHGGKQKQMMNATKALKEIDENQFLPNIVVLIQMLCSFSKTLEDEINNKT